MRRYVVLAPLLAVAAWGCSDGITSPPPGFGEVPSVGDVVAYNVAPSCALSNQDERSGRVVAVSSRAIIVVDESNPPGGLNDSEYAAFGAQFDAIAYNVVVENFGEPTDLDGNERVVVFFTRKVNEMSDPDGRSLISGFFWPGDLFPRQTSGGLQGCPNSNHAEIVYLVVPDPDGVAGPQVPADHVRRTSVSTMGHELQHLVNQARRLYVNESAQHTEDVWLNEGLSHIAEELMFYQVANIGPGSNIDADALRQNRINAFNGYQWSNLLRLSELLQDPNTVGSSLVHFSAPVGTRGGIWSFLRYAADRRGGSEQSLWWGLLNTDLAGVANLEESLGSEPFGWIRDWSAALYAADEVPVEPRFDFPSWNLRDLYTELRTTQGNPVFMAYPLKMRQLDDANLVGAPITSATGMYIRVRAPAGDQTQVTVNDGQAPAALRLSVVNTTTGAVDQYTGSAAGTIQLQGGAQGTDYVLVPVHASGTHGATLNLVWRSTGAAPLSTEAAPLALERPESATLLGVRGDGPRLQRDDEFHLELLERARRELAPLVPAARQVYRDRAFRSRPQ